MKHWLKALLILAVFGAFRPQALGQAPTKEQLDEIKGALDGINESAAEYRGYVDALRKIKITGYLQPQWRYTDLINTPWSIGAVSGGAFPANTKNVFQVRRGRLKFNYDNTLTQFVIQFDAIQTGFTLKDAYLQITEPWSKSVGFQMGVFDRPFGYEISYSSSSRETPERSRMYQTLFPGERELGAKLFWAPPQGPFSFLRADVGVFNGSGPTANEFDNFKDVIGHVAAQFPFQDAGAALDLGVSGYLGNVRNNTNNIWSNGVLPNGLNGFVKSSDTTNNGAGIARTYLGFDAQFYYDVPSIGGLILRGEYIFGTQPGTSSTTSSPAAQPAGDGFKRSFSGYYVYLIQNIGNDDQILVKYDVYNPNTNVSASDFSKTNSTLGVADLTYNTLGLGLVHHWDANVKFVFYYEIVSNTQLTAANFATNSSLYPYTDDVRDNVFTFRVQYKF
jgi:hypothetical protein